MEEKTIIISSEISENTISIINQENEKQILTEKEYNLMGGTTNYELLSNKPKINNVELIGDKTYEDLGFYSITNEEIDSLWG